MITVEYNKRFEVIKAFLHLLGHGAVRENVGFEARCSLLSLMQFGADSPEELAKRLKDVGVCLIDIYMKIEETGCVGDSFALLGLIRLIESLESDLLDSGKR